MAYNFILQIHWQNIYIRQSRHIRFIK